MTVGRIYLPNCKLVLNEACNIPFTATEAGAICAVYSLVVGVFIYKELKWKHIWPIVKESVLGTATIMSLVCACNALGYFMTYLRIPHAISQMIINANLSKYAFLVIVNSLTKGAIIAFTTGLAREVGEYNITVNAVSPGNINTYNELPELSYMNRSGTPTECANVICFLASDEASFVSGSNYVVDGSRKKI